MQSWFVPSAMSRFRRSRLASDVDQQRVQPEERRGADDDPERGGRAEAAGAGVLGEQPPDEPDRVQQQQAVGARRHRHLQLRDAQPAHPSSSAPPRGASTAPGRRAGVQSGAMHARSSPRSSALEQALRAQGYLADRPTAVSLFLAGRLGKPLLLEGPAGTGKTELAKALAAALGRAADPPAVLRGPRRGQGPLRVGVRQAAALHADPARRDRRRGRRGGVDRRGRRDRAARGKRLLHARFPPAAPAARGDPLPRALRAAHRRDRPRGRGVRGLPPRGPLGLPGERAGAGHARAPRRARRSF